MMENHFGKTYNLILKEIARNGGLTFMQLDPPNYNPELCGKIAKVAEENGLDAFAVGGSVGAQGELLDDTLKAIKENSSLPTILFPGNIATISKYADAAYFMYLMNSNDPYFLSGAQIGGAFPMKRMGVEPIPTAYIIIEPGRAAGWIGKAQLIPRDMPYLAAATALAGQFMGAHLVILESGGGAPESAPLDMVSMTKKTIGVPLIVAGGCRTPQRAYDTIKAGADVIQVGTAFEGSKGDLKKMGQTFKEITSMVKKAGKEKK